MLGGYRMSEMETKMETNHLNLSRHDYNEFIDWLIGLWPSYRERLLNGDCDE